jgi:CheY-like chemotaxis protein
MDESGRILLIDDDFEYALLVQLALREARVPNPITVLGDGEEARKYLAGAGEYADRSVHPMPALLLMDLRMPRLNGLELLDWIRRQGSLAHVPVVVLTGSAIGDEPRRALELGACCFKVKPFSYRELVGALEEIRDNCLASANPLCGS